MRFPRIRSSRVSGPVAAVTALLSLSCFEPPVTETLEVRFLPGLAAVVVVRVKLGPPDAFKENPEVRERIEALRRDLEAGDDAWSRRIRRMDPILERVTLDRVPAGVDQLTRRVLVEAPESLPRFFSDTLVAARFEVTEEAAELILTPGSGGRAARAQREDFNRFLDPWLKAMAEYLESGADLYRHLERNPDRARACFGRVFEDLLSAESRGGIPEPGEEERPLVDAFREAMSQALGLYEVPPGSPYTLDELSRLIHDPFPAPLTVRVPGPILAKEGFVETGPGVLEVPGLSLGSALLAEEERWIRPNPMVILYRNLRGRRSEFSLDAFLARSRSAVPAGEKEIHDTLAAHFSRAPVYRVRWKTLGLRELEGLTDRERFWSQPALADAPGPETGPRAEPGGAPEHRPRR